MTGETTPRIQRVYLRFEDAGHGMMRLAASLTPPTYAEPVLVLLSRGIMPLGQPISLLLVSDPTRSDALRGPPGKDGRNGVDGTNGTNGTNGRNASAYLGTVTIAQTATVAIAAGVRRFVLTIPASLGVAAGDSLYLAPTKAIDGYALHDVVAVSPTSLSIGLTAPLLAIGASFSLPCKLFRLNT